MRTLSILAVGLPAAACVSEHGPLTNRMSQAATPYLARAARQPVSWQAWGREAFALAARLDRAVLLYVGADDCRWCAVMDREVYGDPALGALIDSLFVPVRVDRDERPDVAERYEAAVHSLVGLRGYPVTVFLTPDGSAFFGGTYFPADDPVTGRGLKQILPDVAEGYRERRAFILRHAALVRQLALTRGAPVRGVLRPSEIESEVAAVRSALRAIAEARRALGSFAHTQAVGLLLATYGRTGDSSYLDVARRVLDFLVDSGGAAVTDPGSDDPPPLVRAGLLRSVAVGWALTGEPRYRDAARALLSLLARDVRRDDQRAVYADREAYLIGSIVDAAAAVVDSAAAARALGALDALLHRTYARGRGVRHTAGGVSGLLQDQVQVAGACLAAYGYTGARRYLAVAQDVAATLDRDFADSAGGGYFDVVAADPPGPPGPPAPALADRAKPVLDDLLPGANAWAARVLLQLGEATGDARYRRRAEATLEAFAGTVAGEGVRASSYLATAQYVLAPH
ncbi:MAG TPA: DUF255 domain-containing protein [Gemmatimonadales bacterium]|nr:DUF255 domain-containing protein [Gemmatimonadales bacterium]